MDALIRKDVYIGDISYYFILLLSFIGSNRFI
jgi:hypothetical protein